MMTRVPAAGPPRRRGDGCSCCGARAGDADVCGRCGCCCDGCRRHRRRTDLHRAVTAVACAEGADPDHLALAAGLAGRPAYPADELGRGEVAAALAARWARRPAAERARCAAHVRALPIARLRGLARELGLPPHPDGGELREMVITIGRDDAGRRACGACGQRVDWRDFADAEWAQRG
eukprot:gene51342-57344_t